MDTPKQRFQKTEHSKMWFDLSVNPAVVTALEYAFLQFVHDQPMQDANVAVKSAFRIDGAREFIRTLTEISVAEKPRARSSIPINLPEP